MHSGDTTSCDLFDNQKRLHGRKKKGFSFHKLNEYNALFLMHIHIALPRRVANSSVEQIDPKINDEREWNQMIVIR